MVIALIIAALAMVVAGAAAMVGGRDGIGLESGWALFLAGSVSAAGGIIVLALAFILRELKVLPDRLEAAQPADSTDEADLSFAHPHPLPSRDLREPPRTAAQRNAGVEPAGARTSPPLKASATTTSRASSASEASPISDLPSMAPTGNMEAVFPDFSPRALLRASRSRPVLSTAGSGETGELRAEPPTPRSERSFRDGRSSPRAFDPQHQGDIDSERTAATNAAAEQAGQPVGDLEAAGLSATEAEKATSAAGEVGPAVVGTYSSNGTAYVMYADGSIEADTPEGLFRFGSLDELKAHIARKEADGNREPPRSESG